MIFGSVWWQSYYHQLYSFTLRHTCIQKILILSFDAGDGMNVDLRHWLVPLVFGTEPSPLSVKVFHLLSCKIN